jgi:hypothetical protein
MKIAADICVYTNGNLTVEVIEGAARRELAADDRACRRAAG